MSIIYEISRAAIILPLIFFYTCVAIGRLILSFIKSPFSILGIFDFRRGPIFKAPPPKWNDEELGTHGFLSLSNVNVHYVSIGDKNKPLMLFIHGFPECWYSWHYQIVEFSKNYRVVAFDQRGYSLSSKFTDKKYFTIEKLSADVSEVIQTLGYKNCVLVGHDWGGAVAWNTAINYPQLVSKLIIMNCPHPTVFSKYLRSHFSQLRKSWYMFFFQMPYIPEWIYSFNKFEALSKIFTSRVGVRSENMTSDDIDVYRYAFSQPGATTGPINYYRANFHRSQAKLPTNILKMPVLIIWGMQDAFLNHEMAAECSKYVNNLLIKYIEDATHFVQLDRPEIVNNIMWQFLK
ncbi:epoxide hydrolase 4 [Octopus bimaculoides]|uniref:AB hydrolase-1 domain-containing protein n=1 Tax=Octopus bimaculoides TaxID=37653 RepID=A0A0L8HX05_OCTBM|nr:epoxide hydrolase 4 [Octopus bimaculoides]|eukprot:XP_014768714.1 PREDICTED: epoxide hydrolase 4-like [Octopus bimaculoides]